MLYFALALVVIVFVLAFWIRRLKSKLYASHYLEDFWFKKWIQEADENIGLMQENEELRLAVRNAHNDYLALAQGRDEESESYEMQFLSFSELLEDLGKANEKLRESQEQHFKWCLPDLITVDDFVLLANEDGETPIYYELVSAG